MGIMDFFIYFFVTAFICLSITDIIENYFKYKIQKLKYKGRKK